MPAKNKPLKTTTISFFRLTAAPLTKPKQPFQVARLNIKNYYISMNLRDVTNFLGLTNVQEDNPPHTEVPKVLMGPAEERKVLYQWTAQSRPDTKNYDVRKLKNFAVIGVIVGLLLIAMNQFFLVFVVLSMIFLTYMLMQTKPEKATYQITNQGIKYDLQFYSWTKVKQFFPTQNGGLNAVAVDLLDTLPPRIFLTVKSGDLAKVTSLLEKYAHHVEEEPKTVLDRALERVSEKLDLENKN